MDCSTQSIDFENLIIVTSPYEKYSRDNYVENIEYYRAYGREHNRKYREKKKQQKQNQQNQLPS